LLLGNAAAKKTSVPVDHGFRIIVRETIIRRSVEA
jgi:hypothetical protein